MQSILIVEDDLTYGMMLKTWLGKQGFAVASASNVARARKHIETEDVDLILSDLRLPDHDGTDLLRWLAEKQLPIPLIIMTGYADIQSAVQAMKLGACDYVAKPVNPDELLRKIGEALNASPVRQQPEVPMMAPVAVTSDFLEGESDAARQLYTGKQHFPVRSVPQCQGNPALGVLRSAAGQTQRGISAGSRQTDCRAGNALRVFLGKNIFQRACHAAGKIEKIRQG